VSYFTDSRGEMDRVEKGLEWGGGGVKVRGARTSARSAAVHTPGGDVSEWRDDIDLNAGLNEWNRAPFGDDCPK
jgi:hypothetical protein